MNPDKPTKDIARGVALVLTGALGAAALLHFAGTRDSADPRLGDLVSELAERLDRIEAPALVIVGELDQETPPAYARELAAGLRRARLEVISGVGHLSPHEAPDRFNELALSFIDAAC